MAQVAEHIAREDEDTFLANLARHVDHLVISWAVEGQGGTGHVNCRDPPDAEAALARHGFVLDANATALVRAASRVSYIRHSVAVFHRVR